MSLTCIESNFQILQAANRFLTDMGKSAIFDVHLVGLSYHLGQSTGLFTVSPDLLLDEVKKTDLIIIPPIYGDPKEVLANNGKLIPWIIKQFQNGAEVASFCLGAFLLASTGLLEGKQCTTHWSHAAYFRKMFPNVELLDDRIVTDAGGIYTSGGAFSSPRLSLHLIEKYAGREIAILAAKTYMIDIDQTSQAAFVIFQGQHAHGDQTVNAIQEYIETHLGEKLNVNDLTVRAGIGRRSLERRFKMATGNAIAEYVLRVKIEAAKKRLESGRLSIFEVMYEVGYADLGAFRNAFKKTTKMTPQQYRNKYRGPE